MDEAIAHQALQLYSPDSSVLTPLTGGHAGSAYHFTCEGGSYVLRIMPAGSDLDVPSTRASADWMVYLADSGGPVARPIASARGNLAEALSLDGRDFVVMALHQAQGVLGETLPADAWDRRLSRALGTAVGRMHRISSSYVAPAGVSRRPDWRSIDCCFNPRGVDAYDDTAIGERRSEVMRAVAALPRDPDCYGLIHGDLHSANLFVDADSGLVTFFDFDDCCYGWYAMDIAMSLFDAVVLYGEPHETDFAHEFIGAYLSGYVEEWPLDPLWVGQLPLFLKLLEIGVFTMVERAYEQGTDDPWVLRFMPGRRERILSGSPFVDLPFAELAGNAVDTTRRNGRAAG